MLIDVVDRFGRDAITQVDLGVREHRNRPLAELAPQALAVLATGLRRAERLDAASPYVELLTATGDGTVDVESVAVNERPPIATVPSYRARFG
jgi:glucosyl-3-phosphoglycerate synthase